MTSASTLWWVPYTQSEYLIQLNTIAGRTYNDLSQYPVVSTLYPEWVSDAFLIIAGFIYIYSDLTLVPYIWPG